MEKREPKLTEIEEKIIPNISDSNAQVIDNNGNFDYRRRAERRSFISAPVEKKLQLFTLGLKPERKLTVFALRLAILEKAASGLGAIGFIWATVVLLGGFAVSLEKIDFWFITIILLIEGTRIFSRSHELEWQHQATWSLSDVGLRSFRLLKSSIDFFFQSVKSIFCSIPQIPPQSHYHHHQELKESISTQSAKLESNQEMEIDETQVILNVPMHRIFLSRNTSKILYCIQISSASSCVTLSLMRLIKQNFGEMGGESSSVKELRDSALNIFYALAFSEAMLFLLEKAYWEWRITCCKLMEEVNKECELGPSGMVTVRKFFYDTYSICISGSIFDGLKMDLTSFGMELFMANSYDEQLIGARILRKFTVSKRFSGDALRRIGMSMAVMERLVEMLNWKDIGEEEIRQLAAEILLELAGQKQSSIRVASIPGAIESISSLIHINQSSKGTADEISEIKFVHDQENYKLSAFTLLGLLILKKLTREHANCEQIGNTKDLLPKIVYSTHTGARLLRAKTTAEIQILMVKRSLQVMKRLVSTTGKTGKLLRQEVSDIIFTVSNIREILQYGDNHPNLQKLGIEILTRLALDEAAAENIGSTGVLKELFRIFFSNHGSPKIQNDARAEAAGEALAMLSHRSKNRSRILKLDVMGMLVQALQNPILQTNSAKILRNLCSYAAELASCHTQLKGIATSAPFVFGALITGDQKLEEVMLGLAAQIMRFMTSKETKSTFEEIGIKENQLAMKLVEILNQNQYPQIRVPRLRRFTTELATSMMRNNDKNIEIFRDLTMVKELENVVETTSEIECFDFFCGNVGLIRFETTIQSLVDAALELLN